MNVIQSFSIAQTFNIKPSPDYFTSNTTLTHKRHYLCGYNLSMTQSEPKYRFETELNKLEHCPPDDYQPIDKTLYRWVFEGDYEASFRPKAQTKPEKCLN